MNKAIFLNKDGTLIKDIPNNINLKYVSLNEGVIDALKLLQGKGFYLILITHQAGIAYGYFKEQAIISAIYRVEELLKFKGVYLDGYVLCPHHPEGKVRKYSIDCDCRTPKPGLLLNAAKKYNLDLTSSWILSNSFNDIEAGNIAGCHTIMIENELTATVNSIFDEAQKPNANFLDLKTAAEFILAQTK